MQKKTWYLLAVILVLALTLRLYLAFSTPNFTHASYFHLRQVEEISTTGLPIFEDPLSYSGREYRFLPLFHYSLHDLA